tara:strand:- start:153 stop:668 length:516 start_codon:yes stop_codon:yes gene_type:complete
MDDSYVVLRHRDGNLIINLQLLREHPLIQHEDAKCFRWLSGLEKHPIMTKDADKPLSEQFIRFMDDFNISKTEYAMFQRYLVSPSQFTDQYEGRLLTKIGLKMGIFAEIHLTQTDFYNPQTPSKDYRKQFTWTARMIPNDLILEGWCITVNAGNNTRLFYYRKVQPTPIKQ